MKRTKESGASLIEVMVSLFVLAIGLLGVLAMQTRAMQYNQSAYSFSQAAYLASDLAERIRTSSASTDEALLYSGIDQCNGGGCAVVRMMSGTDLEQWQANIAQRLPSGAGTVERFENAGRSYIQITVRFDDSRAEGRAPTVADTEAPSTALPAYSLIMEI